MNRHEDLIKSYQNKERGYYAQTRPEMLSFVPEDAKTVLDVGCSSGGFGKLIKDSRPGCEVWGIEPDAAAAAEAAQRLDRVINGVLEEAAGELQCHKFDCIVFNDVLEHLANPNRALEISREYLAPTGTVVASIPNILHFYEITKILITQDWQYQSEGILDNTHLRFFTRKSIERMFEESGYKIEKIQGINASYGLKYKVANALLVGRLTDWKYIQFAVQAKLTTLFRNAD